MTHYTKGTQSQNKSAPTDCTHTVSGSISLPLTGFFSPFPHGTGSLSVGNEYLGLEGGPPIFRQNITCSALLDFIKCAISCTGLSPTTVVLSRTFHYNIKDLRPGPRSLAATYGISVDFFSSGYLDVSVPRVRPPHLCIQCRVPNKLGGFPHSEIPGSKLVYQLAEAYRRLLRPSSPVAAKASTMCAYSLDHITPSTLFYSIFSAIAALHH